MSSFEIDLDHIEISDKAELNSRPENRLHQETALVDGAHLLDDSNLDGDVGSWGVDGPDAPIFMLSSAALEVRLETTLNSSSPKSSHGLTQAEADARLV